MKYIVFGFTAIFLALCSKEVKPEQTEVDYLIFGRYFGHCLGEECVNIYKLTGNALYKDTSKAFVMTDFEFVPMDQSDFEVAGSLIQQLPAQLLKSTESFFGCPDCHDQGGMYIALSTNEEIRTWRIDTDKRKVPGYLHHYMNQVNQILENLSD